MVLTRGATRRGASDGPERGFSGRFARATPSVEGRGARGRERARAGAGGGAGEGLERGAAGVGAGGPAIDLCARSA